MAPRARLAQPAERKALNLVVVGSSPTVGARFICVEMSEQKLLHRHNQPYTMNTANETRKRT